MAGISRRSFLEAGGVSAAFAFMAANGVKLKANPLGLPIGSQTYPHRARISSGEFPALLKDMKSIGIDVIELCDPWNYKEFAALQDAKTTRKMLDDAGIKAISCHVGMGILRKQHQTVLDWAKVVGLTQLSTADLGGTTRDGRMPSGRRRDNALLDQGSRRRVQRDRRGDQESGSPDRAAQRRLLQLADSRWPADVSAADRSARPGSRRTAVPDVVDDDHGQSDAYFDRLYPGRFWSAHMQGVDASQGVRGAAPQTLPDKNAPQGRRGGGAPPAAVRRPARQRLAARRQRAPRWAHRPVAVAEAVCRSARTR